MEDLERIGTPLNNMPELPEVETIKNVLRPIVVGNKIKNIEILRPSTILGDVEIFKNSLVDECFLDVTRIGKYLIFHLTNDKIFISHLRMEGKYYEAEEKAPNSKHARVIFHLDNNKKLIYDDSRCFGIMKLSSEANLLKEKEISILGPEPFHLKSGEYLYKKSRNINIPIKSFLLDQTIMTGLGNIYVDETLFNSKIHPLTPAKLITKKQYDVILESSKLILQNAIDDGGSTIKTYHPSKDIDGKFQTKLKVYGKAKSPCPTCQSTLRFIKVNGRGTTFCPNCQQIKKPLIVIGITGRIASGKSSVLQIFKENGIKAISSDDIVNQLYEKPEVVTKVANTFGLTFKNKVDKNELRKYLSIHKDEIKKLNKLIHPLVKKEIEVFIKKEKSGLIAIEVPLLFESKFESMFDYIIAVDVSLDIQMKRLKERNPSSSEELKQIYSNEKFVEYKKMADVVMKNDKDINHLRKGVNSIIDKLKARLG